jgi:hypothetical protein
MILWSLTVLFLLFFTVNAGQTPLESPLASSVSFTRHHQLYPGQESDTVHDLTPTRVQLKTRPTAVYRPRFPNAPYDSLVGAAEPSKQNEELQWDILHLKGPDVKDLHTLAQLARWAPLAVI